MGVQCVFAEIDILRGRRVLERRLRRGETVSFTLTITLDNDFRAWNDDGTSTCFSGEVTAIAEVKPGEQS